MSLKPLKQTRGNRTDKYVCVFWFVKNYLGFFKEQSKSYEQVTDLYEYEIIFWQFYYHVM